MASTVKSEGTKDGWFLATILIATFSGQFDFFVVNVAAPDIQTSLSAGATQLELIVAGYAFLYAAGLITGGRIGDLLGRRRVFITGLIAFAITSALCGAAPTAPVLIISRAFQGLSAAVMLPQVLAFISTVLPPERRGRAMGWFGVASGIGSIAGQGLGGFLVQANLWGLGWRLIFFVNVPIMLIALIATLKTVPDVPPGTRHGVDYGGALVLFLGMAGIMTAALVVQHQMYGVGFAAALIGLAIVAGGIRQQARRARDGLTVMLDPALFTVRSMRWGAIASAAFMGYFGSFMFVLTVLLQHYSHLGPRAAGLVFVPSGVTFMVSSLTGSGWIQTRLRGGLLLGCSITATGLLVVLTTTLAGVPADVLPWWMVLAVSLTGLGNGLILPTLTGLSVSEVAASYAGMASGVVTTVQQFGASFGVTAIGALFYQVGADSLADGMAAASLVHLCLLALVALASVAATAPRSA